MAAILFQGNDNLLRGTGLYTISLDTGLPVYLDASVTAELTLLDSAGDEVGGETWPVPFTYIAGSQGDFLAILRDVLEVTPQEEITAHVTFDNGTDQLGSWDGRLVVMERTF